MTTSSTRKILFAASAAAVLFSRCTAATQTAIRQVQQAAQESRDSATSPVGVATSSTGASIPILTGAEKTALQTAQDEAAIWASQRQANLKPVVSGNGVAVFEPLLPSSANVTASTRMRDFGAGCARWLQLQVGGQGVLGKTPLWGALADAQNEYGLTSLRLHDDEAIRVASGLQATHAVVGAIAGRETSLSLTLRVLDLKGEAVGAPIVVAGAPAMLVEQLPSVARQIASRLGVKNASISTTALSSDDITFLGSVPRKSRFGNMTFPQESRLRQIASRDALPGVIWLYSDARDERRLYQQVVDNMLSRANGNALVWGTMGWRAPRFLKPREQAFEAMLQRYPGNSMLALAESSYRAFEGDEKAQMQAVERAIASSPKSGMAWVQLSSIYFQ